MKKDREFTQTRLGYIPYDWEVKKLEEIASITMGQSPKSEYYNENHDGFPLIQGNADCENRHTKPRLYTTQITKTCNIGDIIMTVRAPVGYVSKSLHHACIGRGVCSIKAKKNQEYLYYYLISYEDKWKRMSQGSTFESINSNDIKKLDVILPPSIEQSKIASILSTWDKAIELKEKLIEQKKEQKKGLMQKLLTGEVRFPGFEEDWKEVKIKDIAEIFLGLTYTPQYVQEGVPFLSVKDLDGDKLNFDNVKYISREEYEKSTSNAKPQKGDMLFGRVGTLGNPVILDEDVEFCIFVSLGFLRMKNEHTLNYFVKYWMESNLFSRQVEAKVAGSSQKNLNTGWLKEFKLILPEYNEQKTIVNVLRNVDKEINMLEQEKNLLTQQKKGLMQLLLTGKVRVKV